MPPSRAQSPTAMTSFGCGRRLPGASQRLGHVAGDRTRDEQAVGVAGRGDEVQAEALEVVVRAGEPGDLQLAGVAGAGVDLTDGQRAAEERDGSRRPAAGPGARPRRPRATGSVTMPAAQQRPELAEHGSAPRGPARLLAELAQHALRADEVAIEDLSGDVEQLADQRIAQRVAYGGADLAGRHHVRAPQDGRAARTRWAARGRGRPGAPARCARRRGGPRGCGCGSDGREP